MTKEQKLDLARKIAVAMETKFPLDNWKQTLGGGENLTVVTTRIVTPEELASGILNTDRISISSLDPFRDASMIHGYQLDGNLTDVTGTADALVTTPVYDTGKFNQSLKIVNNTTDTVINQEHNLTIPNGENILNASTPMSLSFWFKFDSTTGAHSGIFVSDIDNQWTTDIHLENNKLALGGRNSSSDNYTTFYTGADTLNPDTWYHVVLVKTSNASTWALYLNGVLLSDSITHSFRNDHVNFIFGGGENEYHFEGNIDQIQIFNRVLTQNEITKLYNAADFVEEVMVGDLNTSGGVTLNITDEFLTFNKTGLSDAEVIQLVNDKMNEISNAAQSVVHPALNTVTNTVTFYNETAPITNNTVWENPVSIDDGLGNINNHIYDVLPLLGNKVLISGYNKNPTIYDYDPETHTFNNPVVVDHLIAEYGVLVTPDAKRLIFGNNSSSTVNQYDLQADGTYALTKTFDIPENGYLGSGAYLIVQGIFKWDGLTFYTQSGVYTVGDDGMWQKDSSGIPNPLSGISNGTFMRYSFDLKEIVYGNYSGGGSVINFKRLSNDGTTYENLPAIDLSTVDADYNKLNTLQITADFNKPVVWALKNNSRNSNKILTFYRNEDDSWTNISVNSFDGGDLGSELMFMPIDGSQIIFNKYITNQNPRYLMEQHIEVLTLDANSNDPFGDGSNIATFQLDNGAYEIDNLYSAVEHNITYVDGKFNQAAHIVSYAGIELPADMLTNFDALTISCWVRKNSGDSTIPIYSKNPFYSILIIIDSNRQIIAQVFKGDTDTVSDPIDVSSNFVDGEYNHVVLTWDTTMGNAKIYVNNTYVGQSTVSQTTPIETLDAFGFGRWDTDTGHQGDVDQVRIFNRVFSNSEITALYNETLNVATLDSNSNDPFGDGSLIDFYKLDNSTTNSITSNSGTGHDITYDTGKYNQAAVFNGTSSYIDDSTVNISNLSAMTISLWAAGTDAFTGKLVGFSGNNDMAIQSNNNNCTVYFRSNLNPGTINDFFINDGAYHHYSFVIDSNGTKCYRDSGLIGTIAQTFSSTVSSPFTIGDVLDVDNAHSYFKGKIDHIQIFNRVLTDNEINKIYNAQ